MKKIHNILTIIAILSIIFLCIFIFTYPVPTYENLRCYDPNIKVGYTSGKYIIKTDCSYDEKDGVWTCNEGKYNYCLE